MIDALLSLLYEVKDIPGLGFLEGIYNGINAKRGQLGQQIGDLKAQRNNAVHGAKALRNAPKTMKGSKKRR